MQDSAHELARRVGAAAPCEVARLQELAGGGTPPIPPAAVLALQVQSPRDGGVWPGAL